MESLEGMANAVLHARLSSTKRDLGQAERELSSSNAEYNRLLAESRQLANATWYWSTCFEAMTAVFVELAKKHPNDPLFRPTGAKRPGGQIEMEYHKLFDKLVLEGAKKMPSQISRGEAFLSFLRRHIKI